MALCSPLREAAAAEQAQGAGGWPNWGRGLVEFPLSEVLAAEQVADQIEGEARLTKTRLKSGKPRQRITVEELQDSLDEQGEGLFTTNTARRFDWVQQLGQQRSTFVFLSLTKQRKTHKQCKINKNE